METRVAFFWLFLACASPVQAQQNPPAPGDVGAVVEKITGLRVVRQGGQAKISVPQNDLQVRLDGWSITPPMGLSSWAAFAPTAHGAVIMGDFVLKETEIGPVEQLLLEHGLTVSGLHNHFLREQPRVMFMHIDGQGTVENLAEAVKALVNRIRELRGGGQVPLSSPVTSSLPVADIERRLGHDAEVSGGVVRVVIARPDVKLQAHGTEVTSFMGFNTWAAFQGTADRAAVAGDFAMLENEVAPVIAVLTRHKIEVVAVHNHMVHENPRIFFLHYWGVGRVQDLTTGLKDALSQTSQTGAP
ncbi:MAG: DUF1259 domain-containing protein [Acidobacteriota bacterium]